MKENIMTIPYGNTHTVEHELAELRKQSEQLTKEFINFVGTEQEWEALGKRAERISDRTQELLRKLYGAKE